MGQIRIREESATPSTPTEGVVLFPTVATPSILKLLDDAGALTTFALLEKAQSFMTTQTFAPTSTSVEALVINMPTSASNNALTMQYNGGSTIYFTVQSAARALTFSGYDNGTGIGPIVIIGRNTNGSTPSAGSIRMTSRAAADCYVWPDNISVLRIGTTAPTSANDLSGTVVGAQTSSLDTKNVISEFEDNAAALKAIIATPLYRFRYKDGRYGQEFMGIITDYAPLFGVDRDEEHPSGKSLNEINAHGYALAAIKALSAQVEELQAQVKLLTDGLLRGI